MKSRPSAITKLVLTSDLRVADPVAPVAPAGAAPESPSPSQPRPASCTGATHGQTPRDRIASGRAYATELERRIAELEAAVNAQGVDFEPDGSEDTTQHRPSAVPRLGSRRAAPLPLAPQDGVASLDALVLTGLDADATDTPATDDDRAGRRDASAADAPAAPPVSPSDEELLKHLVAAQTAAVVSEMAFDEAEEAEAPARPADDFAHRPTPEDRRAQRGTPTEHAFSADRDSAGDSVSPDTFSSRRRRSFEEVSAHDGGHAVADAEIFEAESHGRHAFGRSGMEERPRRVLEEDDLSHGLGEAVLDEQALRDLVAEIVREELQGTLGERITRNVRKLVRREIMRAISIRDFE
ncbi:hypothetical protein [Oceaniglobus roseus]|uniref:hypothetical protein n=1 Tax=Oceaniglobus roseus TaxID=1737570 RepID=UPI0012FFDA2A|nr:hypothetical protein [Kandeliimicrobium roseum]